MVEHSPKILGPEEKATKKRLSTVTNASDVLGRIGIIVTSQK